jgi:hypothetical protein
MMEKQKSESTLRAPVYDPDNNPVKGAAGDPYAESLDPARKARHEKDKAAFAAARATRAKKITVVVNPDYT